MGGRTGTAPVPGPDHASDCISKHIKKKNSVLESAILLLLKFNMPAFGLRSVY